MPAKLSIGPNDPDPVGTACLARGANQFYSALEVVMNKTRDIKVEKLPPDLRMIRVLTHFLSSISYWKKEHTGMDRFLTDIQYQLGPYATEAAAFCDSIGAPRTVEFFRRTAAFFPGGTIPGTYKELIKGAAAAGFYDKGPKPLQAIEREFPDAFKELTGALQRWMRANRDAITASVASAAAPRSPKVGVGVAKPAKGKAGRTDLEEILSKFGAPGAPADFEVLAALTEWAWSVKGRKQIPFADVPEGARMIILLDGLTSALNSSGLLYVTDWELGNDFREIRRWAEAIGAHTTVKYLDEYAELFPRKKVPVDRDERSEALEKREARDAKKGLHPIETLDEKYREAALAEIPMRVRDYVRNHRMQFEAETAAAAAQPAGSSPDDLLLEERDFITFNEYMIAKFGAEAHEQLPPDERTRPGDVIEVKVGRRFAYLQATHLHPYSGSRGPVMRAVEGIVPSPLEGAALAKHVAGATAFVGLVRADQARKGKKAKLVARGLPIPAKHKDFPTFLFHWGKTRDGRNVWGEWKGGRHALAQHVGPLTPELMSNPIESYYPYPESIGEAFRDGWTPAQDYAAAGESP